MGRLHKEYLEGPDIFVCTGCGTHLTSNDQIISKSFHGRGGRAYLFNLALNVVTGPVEKRVLTRPRLPASNQLIGACKSV